MKTILVVDDSSDQRALLRELLSEKFNIIEAVDGAAALEIVEKQSENVDLMLLDIMMPNVDGVEVLQTLESKNLIDKLPIVILSADDSRETIGSAYIYGVENYITKPYKVDDVLRKVTEMIK